MTAMSFKSPIPLLPTETVINILLHCINAVLAENGNTPNLLLNLSLVSRHWKEFVFAVTDFWADINLDWPLEQQEFWLGRSLTHPTHIHSIDHTQNYDLALEHVERWRSVTMLRTPAKTMEYFLEDVFERNKNLAALRSLELECDPFGPSATYPLPDNLLKSAPGLRSLSTASVQITNVHLIATQLTTLELFSLTYAAEDLMGLIRRCQNLEHLVLGGMKVHGPYEMGRMTLRKLRTLQLRPGNSSQCVELVLGIGKFGPCSAHLRAPALNGLYLWYDGPCDVRFTNAVAGFLRESPYICSLGISGDEHRGPVSALAKLPGLGCPPLPPATESDDEESEEYHRDKANALDDDQHTPWMNDVLLCPNLRHLILDKFVPKYPVRIGDRYHSLLTKFMTFRLGLPLQVNLKRLTLEGWSAIRVEQICENGDLGKFLSVDGDMRGGILPHIRGSA